jgi:hypothetical protein
MNKIVTISLDNYKNILDNKAQMGIVQNSHTIGYYLPELQLQA